jgi:FkbM family methyltransferase
MRPITPTTCRAGQIAGRYIVQMPEFNLSQPLAQTDRGHNRLKRCRHGYMLYNVNDLYIGRALDLYGEFSELELEAFSQLVGPGDVVLDVGANIGTHSVWFAQAVAPAGAVISFEPQRLVYQTLCANIALNSLKNVVCHQVAVGAEPGEISVPIPDPSVPQNFGGIALGASAQGEPVPVVTLDELAFTRCKLIKIDVEGMELDVLRGATQLIAATAPVLYVESDREKGADELVRYIDSLGYDLYWHCPAMFNPENFFHNAQNVFGNTISRNLLCMPRGSRVENVQRVTVPAA